MDVVDVDPMEYSKYEIKVFSQHNFIRNIINDNYGKKNDVQIDTASLGDIIKFKKVEYDRIRIKVLIQPIFIKLGENIHWVLI